jgi:hypothetical protein
VAEDVSDGGAEIGGGCRVGADGDGGTLGSCNEVDDGG